MAKAQVVFATITGNNEDIADIITEQFEALGVEVTETEISQTEADDLKKTLISVSSARTPMTKVSFPMKEWTSMKTLRDWT